MNWIQEFQYKMRCYCPCHVDFDNVFSFTEGVHCDKCFDRRIKKKEIEK